jgi:glutamate formiminotransferase/formiminotetrahydrofolate cyclodeaminase
MRGQLPGCLAIGWYVPEYEHVQVSMNLTDYALTPPHVAYQAVQAEAAKLGVSVTGSELVGMIPMEAMLNAGRAFCDSQGRQSGMSQDELIAAAVEGLGLESHQPFNAEERIIELALKSK